MPASKTLSQLLLVEDDPVHADLVRVSIEECGSGKTAVHHASDGVEAWEYLQSRLEDNGNGLPDVILLDVRMPRMNGIDLLKRIKGHAELKVIPTIMLTTSASEDDRENAYLRHANSFLTKPIDFEQFQNLVQELEHYWTATNQPPPSDGNRRMRRAG